MTSFHVTWPFRMVDFTSCPPPLAGRLRKSDSHNVLFNVFDVVYWIFAAFVV